MPPGPRPARALMLAAAALGVGAATARDPGRRFDLRAWRALNSARGPAVDAVLSGITELGSIFGSGGAALALAAGGRRRAAARAFGAAAVMWGLGQILKKVYLRDRPYTAFADTRLLIGRPRGTSWPSSHPAVLTAFLTVAARDLDLDVGWRRTLAGVVGAVVLSRVYLGVHFPSDVVGGVLLGRAVGVAWPGPTRDAPVQ